MCVNTPCAALVSEANQREHFRVRETVVSLTLLGARLLESLNSALLALSTEALECSYLYTALVGRPMSAVT